MSRGTSAAWSVSTRGLAPAARKPPRPPGQAGHLYDHLVPRLWAATLVILVACLLASMVIAITKLT
jgi:hypothetical protein